MYDYYSVPRYQAYKATSTTESKVSHEQIVPINSFVDIDFCHEGMYEWKVSQNVKFPIPSYLINNTENFQPFI